ncbi:GNAT family N-acetyltransferase [Ktedonosporobacter rubrisoli]|nr:GNAT family N-acetyltransferase [Ktedonosporobacter rubrisoli]
MTARALTLLRLHIEAVWGIQLPPLTHHTVELLAEGKQPSWKLYAAEIANTQLAIYRPDIALSEREALFARARQALACPPTAYADPQHISREVALEQVAKPSISMATAQRMARLLTLTDQEAVDRFEPGEVEYYFHSERRPLVGVIVEGRLLCIAHSSRRTAQACELGIETLPEARRRGYALAATLLWADAVAREGLISFYSASATNTASLRLAAAAGYRAFAQGVTIDG